MSEKNGGPAFPDIVTDFDYHYESEQRWPNTYSHGGMTLRDYFAAKVLQGLYSAHRGDDGSWSALGASDEAAKEAYKAADAMLKARSEPQRDEGKGA